MKSDTMNFSEIQREEASSINFGRETMTNRPPNMYTFTNGVISSENEFDRAILDNLLQLKDDFGSQDHIGSPDFGRDYFESENISGFDF